MEIAQHYQTFFLRGNEFALPKRLFREMMAGRQSMIAPPITPLWLMGTIRRNGISLSIVDLAIKVDPRELPIEITEESCILVIQLHSIAPMIGIFADGPGEIIHIQQSDLTNAALPRTEHGITRIKITRARTIRLLDPPTLFAPDELEILRHS